MNFIKFLRAASNSIGVALHSSVLASCTKRLAQLFQLSLLVLSAGILSAPASYATVIGTSVTLVELGETAAVGSGVAFDRSGGAEATLVDVNPGANNSVSVSVHDATNYKWQVSSNAGESFTNISNGGFYSGATSGTQTIAALSIGMNGDQYRAVASGSTSPDAISNAATLTVNKAAPTISVSASNSNPLLDAPVTFKDGTTTLGTGTISGTTATFATSALTVGAHSVTTKYAGAANNTTATSAPMTVTVVPPPFAMDIISPTAGDTLVAGSDFITIVGRSVGPSSAMTVVTLTINGAPLVAITDANGYFSFSLPIDVYFHAGANTITATSLDATKTISVNYKVVPTLSVAASSNTPASGETVTFTATVASASSPSGTVTFKDGATVLGTGTVSGGTATFTTSALAVGAHSITAEYDGDTQNIAATSASVAVMVKAAPTISVSASDSNPVLGASVTFIATLAGGLSPTGTVTFKDGATILGTSTISGTTANFATSALTVGAHSITAEYAGDTNNATTSSAATTVTVRKTTPTVSVSASDSNPVLGASVTFIATLAGGSSPTGTVTFKDDATILGTGTISGTTATFATSALTVGAHSITAEYAGDTNNATTSSAATTVTVGKTAPTISVSASDSSPAFGATVTFIATLAGGSSPTGTVTFKDGAIILGTGTISGTTANFATSALTVGAHSITAEYAGDTNNATTSSAATTVTVGKTAPTISVSASDSSPAFGATVTFMATLAGGSSPTGTVTFKDGAIVLGTGTISGTTATFATSALTVGAHSITAEYAGDTNNANATSTATTVTVAAQTFAFTPAAGAFPAGTANAAYSQSVTATASGGTAPITYAVTSGALPAGLKLDSVTGAITGTPTTAGSYSFTITAIDSANPLNSDEASYTMTIKSAVTFTFSPASGKLPEAMAGEDYSQVISAAGGAGNLTYSLASGSLPNGMVLNVSTGELSGPLAGGSEVKEYSFLIQVTDGNSATGTATYTIQVKARDVTVTDKKIDVPAGSAPNNVDLIRGATGGPFVAADIVTVNPAYAGTASIVRGEFAQVGPTGPLGWYLKFIPNPAYSGQVSVQFRLTSALGISNTGTVTYMLGYDAAEVAAEIDELVHGFVQSRQSLIASTIKVPGLLERRQTANITDPVTARMTPSKDGMTASFKTSLAQMEAVTTSADGVTEAELSPFNIWIDGTFMLHKRQNDGKWGNFGMVSAGADYLLWERR